MPIIASTGLARRTYAGAGGGPWNGPSHVARKLPVAHDSMHISAADARSPANASADCGAMAPLLDVFEAYQAAADRLRQTHECLTQEVRRLREQLAAAHAALDRSKRLAALGEMAAGIAHEVRNPLASIRLYARMLDDDLSDRPEQRRVARQIGHAVRGLDNVVGDVLAFARELRPRWVDAPLRTTIDSAIDALRPALESARVAVVRRVDRRLQVMHDPDLLRQVLINLVRNSMQAMPAGGRVTIAAQREHGSVTLSVHDTGPGIAGEDLDRIFNPFFTTRQEGTGLGLAIVHRIVDAHGGSISAANRGGAVFTITFPSHVAEQAA